MQKSKQMKVFPADGGFRIVRRDARDRLELLERTGAVRSEFDTSTGVLIGFRIVGVELRKVDSDLPSVPSTAAMSGPNPKTRRPGEMEINCERSRTRGLSELRRLEREKHGELPEDKVERVQAKVRVYAVISANRGDILRVWPR